MTIRRIGDLLTPVRRPVRKRARLAATFVAISPDAFGDMDTKDIPIRMVLYGDQEIERWSHRLVARAHGMQLPTITVPKTKTTKNKAPPQVPRTKTARANATGPKLARTESAKTKATTVKATRAKRRLRK